MQRFTRKRWLQALVAADKAASFFARASVTALRTSSALASVTASAPSAQRSETLESESTAIASEITASGSTVG